MSLLAFAKHAVHRLLRIDSIKSYADAIREHLCTLERFINKRVDDTQQFMHALSGAHHSTAERLRSLEQKVEQLETRLGRRMQAMAELLADGSDGAMSSKTGERSVNRFLSLTRTSSSTHELAAASLVGSRDLSSLGIFSGAKVLELGASSLHLVESLLDQEISYRGLAFSPLFVESANQQLINAPFIVKRRGELPSFGYSLLDMEAVAKLSRERFDVIFIAVSQTNWSIKRVEWLLQVASPVLAPSGRLFLSLPISDADQKEIGWRVVEVCKKNGLEASGGDTDADLPSDETSTDVDLLMDWCRGLGGRFAVAAFRQSGLT